MMLDLLERQWHTANLRAAIMGDDVEEWAQVQQRFDLWLEGKEVAQTKEEEMRGLLGLS